MHIFIKISIHCYKFNLKQCVEGKIYYVIYSQVSSWRLYQKFIESQFKALDYGQYVPVELNRLLIICYSHSHSPLQRDKRSFEINVMLSDVYED
jgi:hypothetical protein